MKSEPIRMCVGCRQRKSKYELLRFVAREGKIFFDPYYKAEGRGMSICPSRKCLQKALKKQVLERALRCELREVPSAESLREEVLGALKKAIVDTVRLGVRFKGVVVGREAVFKERHRVKLLILAEDLSEGSKEEFFSKLNADSYELFTKNFWGEVLNRRSTGIIGVVDRGLAEKLKSFLDKYTALYRRW
ncbi:hypothetical protein TST_0102 [Thermosulfidibacter takaii ABI70S6]|uniref:YlxR domain-containing protein n=1 Tax=Thermosulfidibacter takaii (strain DSM 17441 / JCM 13301 / NBRC 103674 / ABI70S6) TaxID=1298851 RepID=A0A0S3QRF0_THET7|nr:DUF448 domain-containing protein [Thermosulfidibacter takaii]BAT70912.1 hypothetical protein TST_0102 [Thermosulfidibacter takaii ABI70S6]